MDDQFEQVMARVRDAMAKARSALGEAACAYADGAALVSPEVARGMQHCTETLLSTAKMCDDLVRMTNEKLAKMIALREEYERKSFIVKW